MENDTYIKVFDNYLPQKRNKSQLMSARLSYEYIINTNQALFDKLASHIQNAPSEYKSFLEYIKSYLFHPNMFAAIPDKLISLRDSNIIFSEPEAFFYYLMSQPSNAFDYMVNFSDVYFHKLYNLYYSYLKNYTCVPAPFNRYISNVYKTTSLNPLFYNIFMNPASSFCYINKELSFFDPYYGDRGFGLDVINMLQRHQEGFQKRNQFSPKKLMPLLNTLPKILADSSFHTSAPYSISNYSFSFSAKRTDFYAYFDKDGVKFEKNKDQDFPIMRLIDLDRFSQVDCSQSWIDILYVITGGIKQNIDNLSILFTLIMTNYYKNIRYTLPSNNCSPLLLYIVYASKEQADYIRHLLDEIIPHKLGQTDYQLKDLTKRKNILDLMMNNFYTPAYIPVKPSKSTESDVQIKTIKRIIQRKEIKVKDDYGLDHIFINHLPVICFVDDPKQLTWIKTNFETKVFNFLPASSLSPAGYKLQDSRKLACFLSIYGLKLLYDSNHRNKSNIKWQNQTENITESFFKDCLKSDEGYVCYAEDLYKVYYYYYNLFYGGSPLTQIRFTKELRRLLANKSILYQYKKPRSSRSDNRYAFVGIKIDREKAKNAADRAAEMRNSADKSSFTNYLIDMQNSVNEILQSLYHELYE